MTKKRRVLIGSVGAVALATVLVIGLGSGGAWVDPPDLLHNAAATEDRARITRTEAGMAGGRPVRLAIRRRVYELDMSSREVLDNLKRRLPASRWPIKTLLGPDSRRNGVVIIQDGMPSPNSVSMIVWETPGRPTTRVEFQEIRSATVAECAVESLRGLFPRR